MPSNVKDTSDFISKPKAVETIPGNSYLASLDVKYLYGNVTKFEGIKAVKSSHKNLLMKRTLLQEKIPSSARALSNKWNI